jgi:hypothetical protein
VIACAHSSTRRRAARGARLTCTCELIKPLCKYSNMTRFILKTVQFVAPSGALKVPAHAAPRPPLELLVDVLADVDGLEPQRVAAEVDARRRVGRVRVDHRVVEELAPRHRVRGVCQAAQARFSSSAPRTPLRQWGSRGKRACGRAGTAPKPGQGWGGAPSLEASAASSTWHPVACACSATHASASSCVRHPPIGRGAGTTDSGQEAAAAAAGSGYPAPSLLPGRVRNTHSECVRRALARMRHAPQTA